MSKKIIWTACIIIGIIFSSYFVYLKFLQNSIIGILPLQTLRNYPLQILSPIIFWMALWILVGYLVDKFIGTNRRFKKK